VSQFEQSERFLNRLTTLIHKEPRMSEMPKKLTKADALRDQAYDAAKPNPFGNLHQRMQAVMKRAREIKMWEIDSDLWQHLHDLQGEVAMHEPAKPPYGRRTIPREIAHEFTRR